MREAFIVSTARTPIGKAFKGAFNDTQAQALAGHAIAEAQEGLSREVFVGQSHRKGSFVRAWVRILDLDCRRELAIVVVHCDWQLARWVDFTVKGLP